jgi:hypothetical protein
MYVGRGGVQVPENLAVNTKEHNVIGYHVIACHVIACHVVAYRITEWL